MKSFCAKHGKSYHDGVAFVRGRIENGAWSEFLPVSEVGDLVKKTMEMAVKSVSGGKIVGVSKTAIIVEVQSTNVPNLNLVDLPGVCVVPREGEPQNIMEMTQGLVEDYLKLPHTLVLLVMPSTTRIHGYLPLQLITSHRKTAQTIGVITKADMAPTVRFVDPFHELKRKLDGQSEDYVPIQHGYVAVCNRDTVNNDSLEKAACAEQPWFEEKLPGYIAKKKHQAQFLWRNWSN